MRKNAFKDIMSFLKRVIPNSEAGQKQRRLCLMASLINGCIQNKHCRLESLNEPPKSHGTSKKSSLLQQTRRWIGNKWTDWETFFMPFAQGFLQRLSTKGELVFIIDGSQTGNSNTTLMLSVLCRGFAIPVVWVVKKGEKGHFSEETHVELLRLMANICPPDCRVVLLGDGEFDGLQLREFCGTNNWEFVFRTACDRLIDFDGETARFDSIRTTKNILFIQGGLNAANAVYWKEKIYKKPLFLLTNMEVGYQACHYYKKRFKIETLFKNLKSQGFFIHKTQLVCPLRVANLIIVVAFAFILTFCLGCFLKEKTKKNLLEAIVRKDKIHTISPIAIAQRALMNHQHIALFFFSNISKNFDWVFS